MLSRSKQRKKDQWNGEFDVEMQDDMKTDENVASIDEGGLIKFCFTLALIERVDLEYVYMNSIWCLYTATLA